ncbi:MAG: type IV pili methyl-accepting chemotaxis transducer N-terminal domain-containing protein [Campylobacterales bacterium]|nr:type IV pili methyl-accepting chemotaxis transducer N-terminal domain-containing protein [Campylobacterales bacterium]
MNNLSVSSTIKILGALLLSSIFIVISVSIYLNQKNIKDATIVNIAGKQRMLTQKISKNIFYLHQSKSNDFLEMDRAITEFKKGLSILKNGDESLDIAKAPTKEIDERITKVESIWSEFEKNSLKFKEAILTNNTRGLNEVFSYVYQNNDKLLYEVDKILTLYTHHIEEKNTFIKRFQYISFGFLSIFALFAVIQLREIESHAREFFQKYKDLHQADIKELKPIDIDGEKEFVEMANDMNCFINRVNSVMDYSQNALEQSQMASKKLEELSVEFSNILDELENRSEILKQIDKSEDMVIESSEDLLRTTKKLNNLKNQLDKLLKSCQSNL